MDISLNASDKRDIVADDAAIDSAPARQFDEALRREMEHVLASPMFRKTPKLSQLLAYLVQATIRGEGETLKSYTVAVDGLGRDENFDAQADSYPRVQVLRLRNILGLFYSRFEPVDEMCIYLLPGSYRVRLAKFSIAYPDTVGRNGRGRPAFPQPELAPAISANIDTGGMAADAAIVAAVKQPFWHIAHRPMPWHTLTAGLSLVIAALAVAFVVARPESGLNAASGIAARAPNEAPSIMIAPVRTDGDAASQEVAAELQDALEGGFAQSWLVSTHAGGGAAAKRAVHYRFATSLGKAGDNGRPAHFKLIDEADQKILWAQTHIIDPGHDIAAQLKSAVSLIASATGAIGRRELDLGKGTQGDGYRCLLTAHNPSAAFLLPTGVATAKCLQEPIDNRKLEAVRLSALALSQLQGGPALPAPAQMQEAEKLARTGMATDPSAASSYFAMAWSHYAQSACAAPSPGAEKAFAPHSFGSAALAALANAAKACGATKGA